MPLLISGIERALVELISHEEGIKFQRLAVILAKTKWPDLIASERKKDLGTDAHAPALLAQGANGKVLACSLTATLGKIKADTEKIHRDFPDVRVLLFATPHPVTNQTAQSWANTIQESFGIELVVISREDIVTDLAMPSNASICRTLLGLSVDVEPALEDLIQKAKAACSKQTDSWMSSPRLAGKPLIKLRAIRPEQQNAEHLEPLELSDLETALLQSRRLVIEAPAGNGKTTTLIQLALGHAERGELAFLVDLPGWAASRLNVFNFLANTTPYLSEGLHADDLARVCSNIHCSFLLNGWNEVSETYSEEAVRALAELERSFPAAGIAVATRTHHIQPPLPGSFRLRLLPLTQAQRADYLQQALASRAAELHAQLRRDAVLDQLTKTPLILAEVTTLFKLGRPVPNTRMGVLAAVVELMEQSDDHRLHFERQPLAGRTEDYLAALAVEMTVAGV